MPDYESLLRLLVREGNESPKVDFKRSMNLRETRDVAELAKLCLAIANTDSAELEGIGYVVLGAAPSELVGGMDDLGSDSFRASLVASLNRYIEPEAQLEIRAFRDPERGWFGAILVRPSPVGARPHVVARECTVQRFSIRRGECYVRRGEATELANRADYDRLFEERHRDRSRGHETAMHALQERVAELQQTQERFFAQTVALLNGIGRADAPLAPAPILTPAPMPVGEEPLGEVSDQLAVHRAALEELLRDGPQYKGLGVVGLIASLGANLRKNFTSAQMRSRQSEAKANLKAMHASIKAYCQEKDRYPQTASEAGFLPAPGARYLYFFGERETVGGDANPDPSFTSKARNALARLGIRPFVAMDKYLGAAVADLDGQLDVWTIDDTGEPHDVTRNFPSTIESPR